MGQAHQPAQLIQLLDSLPISDWGIADIRGLHPLADKYPVAISMLFGFRLDFDEHCEQVYQSLLVETRVKAKRAMGVVLAALERMGAAFYAVGTVGQNEETLTGDFPLKTAATRAGMGWIGKNGLLVTEKFGPRVRLEAILVDLSLPPGQAITRSRCGDCGICVDSCPAKCLRNAQWHAGMDRSELIDAYACSDYRKGFIPTLGRRLACGWCALTCPKGR
jgi:epoxyqueuosine reductase QueG